MKTCRTLKRANLTVEPGSVVNISDRQYDLMKNILEVIEVAEAVDKPETAVSGRKSKSKAEKQEPETPETSPADGND